MAFQTSWKARQERNSIRDFHSESLREEGNSRRAAAEGWSVVTLREGLARPETPRTRRCEARRQRRVQEVRTFSPVRLQRGRPKDGNHKERGRQLLQQGGLEDSGGGGASSTSRRGRRESQNPERGSIDHPRIHEVQLGQD